MTVTSQEIKLSVADGTTMQAYLLAAGRLTTAQAPG